MDTLTLLLVLIVLSALFSGSESAFSSLTQAEVAGLRGSGAGGRGAARLAGRPNDLIAALVLGNILVNTATGVVTTSAALSLFGPGGLAIAVPAASVLLLVAGDITPKLVALRHRLRVVVLVQGLLRGWVALVSPLVRGLTRGIETALRLVPAERTGSRPLGTEELQTACDLAVEDATLTLTEGRSLARLLGLRDVEVRQIMVPRPDVVMVDRSWERRRILETIQRAGFNRYPVTDGRGGAPLGFFHVKDLLARPGDARPLARMPRPLPVVPESKDVASLLARMRTGLWHMAAVVDEHGDFVGIVTMADCLRALIGRIGDVARSRPRAMPIGDGRWIVDGRIDLRALSETTGLDLPPSRDYVTLAGFVMARLGRVPQPGDRVVRGDDRVVVLAMQGNRVESLEVTVAPPRPGG